MTRIGTLHYRCKRQPRRGPRAAAIVTTLLHYTIVGALLAGCAANTRPSDQDLAIQGYWFHDANHPGGRGAQASQQAVANAIRGTWLWPPASTIRAM